MSVERCKDCRYLRDVDGRQSCCRNPPHFVAMVPKGSLVPVQGQPMAMQLIYGYPPVNDEQWCGEWAAKE